MVDPWTESAFRIHLLSHTPRHSLHSLHSLYSLHDTAQPAAYDPQGQPRVQQTYNYGGELRHGICIIVLVLIRTGIPIPAQIPATAQAYDPQGQPRVQQAYYYGGELRHGIGICFVVLI